MSTWWWWIWSGANISAPLWSVDFWTRPGFSNHIQALYMCTTANTSNQFLPAVQLTATGVCEINVFGIYYKSKYMNCHRINKYICSAFHINKQKIMFTVKHLRMEVYGARHSAGFKSIGLSTSKFNVSAVSL